MADETILPRYFEILDRRRQLAHTAFSSIPGVKTLMPESGILSWLDVRELGSAAEVSAFILEHAKVMVNEGDPYGSEGAGHLRIVHACFMDEARAVESYARIGDALRLMASVSNPIPA